MTINRSQAVVFFVPSCLRGNNFGIIRVKKIVLINETKDMKIYENFNRNVVIIQG